jgi:predicted phage tail protein
MLTKVRLDGVMGKKFGKHWELDVSSPAEALRMIEANRPGLRQWVLSNREKYSTYRVVCTLDDGREEELEDATYVANRTNLKSIRFTPVVEGASGAAKIVVGAIMIAVAYFAPGPWSPYLYQIGAALILGGVVELLSPRPKKDDKSETNSYYFDGPANTERQGNPVPLIYGRMLVGSHPISASISVDEIAP